MAKIIRESVSWAGARMRDGARGANNPAFMLSVYSSARLAASPSAADRLGHASTALSRSHSAAYCLESSVISVALSIARNQWVASYAFFGSPCMPAAE